MNANNSGSITPPTGHATMSSALPDAVNYHAWILDILRNHIQGTRLLEIGSGYGQYTRCFAEWELDITATDIDAECLHAIEALQLRRVVTALGNLDEEGWADKVCTRGRHDTVVALNVLEHIQDDARALKQIAGTLSDGGCFMALVPAFQSFYGPMDALAGHYRRYDRQGMEVILQGADFTVEKLFYINPIGGLGWWWNAKLYKPDTLSDKAVNAQILLFDKWILPLSRFLTPITQAHFGQSLFCLCRKRTQAQRIPEPNNL